MLADRISILRDGERVLTEDAAGLDREKIVRAMVGRSLSGALYSKHAGAPVRPAGDKVLSVQDISAGGVVRNNAFSVFEGQITGLFGLIGSGRTETAKVVAGIMKPRLHPRRPDRAARQARALHDPSGGGARRHRLRDGGPQARRLLRHDQRGRQPVCRPAGLGLAARTFRQHARDAKSRRAMAQDAGDPPDRQRRPGHRTVGRQPAEGGHRQGAGAEAQADRLRRADPGRGRRRHRPRSMR